MHLNRFGKTDRLAGKPFDPSAQCHVLTLNLLRVAPNDDLVVTSGLAQPSGDLKTPVEATSPSSLYAFFSVG